MNKLAPSLLLARDLMNASPMTVRPEDDIHDAIKKLVRRNLSGAPVLDAQRHVVGMLSEKDGIRALMHAVIDRIPSHQVRHVMSTELYTVRPETHWTTIAHTFLHQPVRRLIVIDGDRRLLGLISRRDLLSRALTVFESAPNHEAAVLYLSALEGTIPPTS